MPDGQWKRAGHAEMMVSLDSARQYFPKEKLVACDADHSQISKLKRGESGIYKSVRWAIKYAVLRAAEAQATSHREDEAKVAEALDTKDVLIHRHQRSLASINLDSRDQTIPNSHQDTKVMVPETASLTLLRVSNPTLCEMDW